MLAKAPGTRVSTANTDLTLRLAGMPELRLLRDAVHASVMQAVIQAAQVAARP